MRILILLLILTFPSFLQAQKKVKVKNKDFPTIINDSTNIETQTKKVPVRIKYENDEKYPGQKDFYISTYSGPSTLTIRKDNFEIKDVYIYVTDNFGNCYYRNSLTEREVVIDFLARGEYKVKIRYDGKEINRIVEVF